MKVILPLVPLLGLTALMGVGCGPEKPKARASVLDVSKPQVDDAAYAAAPAPAYYPAPAYQPAPATRQPVAAVAPAPEEVAPAPARAAAPATGSYTVQKGDTLFGIAKTQYGDGNKWKRIATANPGLSPNTLKVGQKIVIP